MNAHGNAASASRHARGAIHHFIYLVLCVLAAALVTACGGGGGGDSASPAIAITEQPADLQIVEGSHAIFSVSVLGDPAFQWQRQQGGTWVDIVGATSGHMILDSVQLSDSGAQLRVVATHPQNAANRSVSSAVTLTVTATTVAPTIIMLPYDLSAVDGQRVSFSATASGTSLSYRWQRSNDGANWVDIDGATLPTLRFAAVTADDQAMFRVIVRNSAGSVTSAAARIRVSAAIAPVFVQHPADALLIAGENAGFFAEAVGAPTPTLGWQTSADAGATWNDVVIGSVVMGPVGFAIAPVTAADDGKLVRAVAANNSGQVFSKPARVVIQLPAAPSIQRQPSDIAVGLDLYPSFIVQASGAPRVSYQWQVSVDGGSTFANINGATDSLLVFRSVANDDTKRFRVIVTNRLGSVTSAVAQLRVLNGPTITLQPADATWRPNQTDALFTASADGSDVHYQWQTSSDSGVTWTDVTFATSPSYVHTASAPASVNAVRVAVINQYGSTISTTARLTALQ